MAKYRVTFLPQNLSVEGDDTEFPYSHRGRPGSVLDVALRHGVPLEHKCGGNCACTTCHVIVHEGTSHLSAMEPEEAERLDAARGVTRRSRLGCQAVVRGEVVVEIVE